VSRDWIVDAGYAAAWRLVRLLPESVAAAGFRLAADMAWRRGGTGVQRLRRNLRRVVGPAVEEAELDRLTRQAMRSYARYWMEAFRLPSRSGRRLVDRFHVPRRDLLASAVEEGRGVILALPHAGNWDLAGAWVVKQGWPLVAVAERLRPESLFQRFVAYRESLGMEILPLTKGTRPPLEVLIESLQAGKVVALLADRDLSARGVPVEFFGAQARMPPGPALLALKTGAPLFAVFLHYEDDRCVAEVEPVPIPPSDTELLDVRVAQVTQSLADWMAQRIGKHPTDWHMLQRVWLEDT